MGSAAAGPATHLSVRPYTAGDASAALGLIDADRLTGQPETTAAMLADALAGRSSVDTGWWAELASPTTDIAEDPAGNGLGIVSYAMRRTDGAGFILWLHCHEQHPVARTLIAHALGGLGPRTVHAFEFATALTHGLEALPVRNRPTTRRALEDAGFTRRDLWRYMHASLPVPDLPRAAHCTVTDSEDPPGKRLEVHDGGTLIAEATIGRPMDGIGVLWWISVTPPARGRGLGLTMLGSSLDLLTALGADQVILYVDDDVPAGDPDRDRTAANHMYDIAGLTEVDRLSSFTLSL